MTSGLRALTDRIMSNSQTVDGFQQKSNVVSQGIQLEKNSLKNQRPHLKNCETAHFVIQEVAQQVQQQAHKGIASVVSRCLAAVFDDAYAFRIKFVKRRNRTEAELVFVKGDQELLPLKATGGGVADVASFALRLACMALSRPRKRRLLVLDEPFRHLHSTVYRERVRELLETLAEEMEVQIIVVTGMTELQTGNIVEIGK